MLNRLKLVVFNFKYKSRNKHNSTHAMNIFDINRVFIGRNTYGGICVNDWSNQDSKLIIGNYCSIGPNVLFLLGSDHYQNTITTYPLKVKKLKILSKEAITKGNIEIGDDVWIGANVIINSGVTIGKGAIVAAGAVVIKNVEPYSIVGGIPAKIIKYRFSNDIIEKMLSLDLVNILDKANSENIDLYYTKLNKENYEEIIKNLEK